jgi:hypothetical protein
VIAQVGNVSQYKIRPIDFLRPSAVRSSVGDFSAVKLCRDVRSIAKRFVLRLPTAAQGIRLIDGEFFAFGIVERIAVGIGAYDQFD